MPQLVKVPPLPREQEYTIEGLTDEHVEGLYSAVVAWVPMADVIRARRVRAELIEFFFDNIQKVRGGEQHCQ